MATRLHRDDLIKHTWRWVTGACIEWNNQVQQFADISSAAFLDFRHRVHHVVYRYLRGQQTLDGTCSDLECTLALEAAQVFGLYGESDDLLAT